jgi:hypothetical protein
MRARRWAETAGGTPSALARTQPTPSAAELSFTDFFRQVAPAELASIYLPELGASGI